MLQVWAAGDLSSDLRVDVNDLKLFVEQWLDPSGCSGLGCADFDSADGVNFADFAILANNWQQNFNGRLFISEFMASNHNTIEDPEEPGAYPDWLEIYNAGGCRIELGGLYLTDKPDTNPTKWQIPEGVGVDANSYILFWADEDPEQGSRHANFKMDADGESVALFASDGQTVIDRIDYGKQEADVSYGRYPDASDNWQFMGIPTPGYKNNAGYLGRVTDIKFSVERGFYNSPFQVRIATETDGATIRYTLDGSSPTEAYGNIYNPDNPIQITKTTVARALAYKAGYMASNVITQTYIFLENVINQPAAPAGFPTSWGPLGTADYAMDSRVVYDPSYYPTIKQDLKTIPSIYIGISINDFFGAADGIYSNANVRELEKGASIEFFDPVTGKDFQINAALRSHGGVGRIDKKHALRMIFKSDYGPPNLYFPLYKDTDVETFNSLVLRSTWNYSWIGDSTACGGLGTQASQYMRDTFCRDTARDQGILTPYGRHVHLYINGLYWGLYKLVERPDDGFAAAHLGGEKEDYDVLKGPSDFGTSEMELLAGDRTAWDAMFSTAELDLSNQQNYQAIQQYLDIPEMIDYLLMIFYTGNRDAPVLLCNDYSPRNFYAIRSREPAGKFVFVPWDCEWSLENVSVNRVNINGVQNPHHLYQRLLANSEFKILLADKIQQRFYNNGVLTSQSSINRYLTRIADIDRAIIGESARWGDDIRTSQPYTRNVEWVAERDRLINNYFSGRTDTVVGQLRTQGCIPHLTRLY